MIELKINGNAVKLDEAQEKVLLGYLKPEGGRWKPEQYNKYWTVWINGSVTDEGWADCPTDKWAYSQRNVFKTKEEAEAHKRYLEAVARLRDSSDFLPDWNDSRQEKYCINLSNRSLMADSFFTRNCGFIVYYPTLEAAEQSIKDHKEDWLTFFGVSHE